MSNFATGIFRYSNSHFICWFRRLYRAHAGRVRQFRVLAAISSRGMGCVEIRGAKYERLQGLGLDKYRNLEGVVRGHVTVSGLLNTKTIMPPSLASLDQLFFV